jgi:hypothetical protein
MKMFNIEVILKMTIQDLYNIELKYVVLGRKSLSLKILQNPLSKSERYV